MAAASSSTFSTLDHFIRHKKEMKRFGEEEEEIGRCECCGRKTKNLVAKRMYDPKTNSWVTALVGPECARHKPILGECRREAARARWYKKRKLKAMPRIAGLSLAEVKA